MNKTIPKVDSEIWEEIYETTFPIFLATGKKLLKTEAEIKEAIHSFFEVKMCRGKSIETILKLKDVRYAKKSFKNHCIDILRKRKRVSENAQKYIDTIKRIEENYTDIEEYNIGKRLKITLEKWKKKVQEKFDDDHVTIFNLIILGHTNPEIAEITGKKTQYIGKIKYKIKKYLIADMAA